MLPTSGKAIKQKVRSMHLGPGFCCLQTFRGCGSTAQPLRGVSACSLDRPWLAMYVNTPGTWVRSLHRQYCQAWLSLYDASTNQILPQAWKNSSTFEQTISALKGSRPPVNYSQGLENPPVTKQGDLEKGASWERRFLQIPVFCRRGVRIVVLHFAAFWRQPPNHSEVHQTKERRLPLLQKTGICRYHFSQGPTALASPGRLVWRLEGSPKI